MSRSGILSAVDEAHLERARQLARSGWGHVHPNPLVGCVLVRDAEVVGEGWHGEFGGPHAEVVALEAAAGRTEGATAYVSLEPCDHQGKTPPCTQALLRAGVRRVVFGAADPGAFSGGGARTLSAGGVEVVGPVWDEHTAWAENPAFHHRHRHPTPWVALKLAMSLDGRISSAPGRRTRITGPEADGFVHRLRSGFDAVMVGAGTARADDPRLTVRDAPEGRVPPRRLVLDPSAGLPSAAALFEEIDHAPVHVFARQDAPEDELERLEASGAHVHPVAGEGSQLDLAAVLEVCRGIGIGSILCEGGARLAASLLQTRLLGRLYLLIAPRALGEDGLAAFGPGAEDLPWNDFHRVLPPEGWGHDTLIVLDRKEM